MNPGQASSPRGAVAAAGAFLIWGVFPLFWKQMEGLDCLELIAHRVTWSLVFLAAVLAFRHGFAPVAAAFRSRRIIGYTAVSGGALTVNWLIYVWAVNHGYVIESSLGYFMVPLVNVAIGAGVLHERLRPLPWLAIGCAAEGVALLLFGVGRLPWIAIALAGSWGLYGLMRRQSPLGSLDGLALETALYGPLAVGYLLWRQHTGQGALGHSDLRTHALVLSTGWVTALPLILFAYGARRIRMTTLGLLQYLTPSLQFLCGLLVYREPFDAARLRACGLIWLGLVLYTADSFLAQRRAIRATAG
jgi:chloramphenicol-sensitive protein RarD